MAADKLPMKTFFSTISFSCCFFIFITSVQSSTIAISENSNFTIICALVTSAGSGPQANCSTFQSGIQFPLMSLSSSSRIVGGEGFICALSSISGNQDIILCQRFGSDGTNITRKRIYSGLQIDELVAGNTHICASVGVARKLQCWPQRGLSYDPSLTLTSIAVGQGFVCGLLPSGEIRCMGRIPQGGQFKSVALGDTRACGLRYNGTVACWGLNGFMLPSALEGIYFRSIEAKRSIFCGIVVSNYSLFCWGNEALRLNPMVFEKVYPGPCRSDCPCQPVSGSSDLCGPGEQICETCSFLQESQTPSTPPQQSLWNGKRVAFLVVGCTGALCFLMVGFFFAFRLCSLRGCRVHNSGRLDEADPENGTIQDSGQQQQQRQIPALEKRLSHLVSMGARACLEEFPLHVLLQATNNFADEHKIGSGSFGSIYRAILPDGQEVAIKRAETTTSSSAYAGGTKRDQQEDKDNAFMNELEFLSRVHHKNLVRLLGYHEDGNERILVYEWMKNGTLHDHLHKFATSAHLTSWTARIKVALDAARGVEYLHAYAVPSIIHRDIKSSNILLDDKWTAKVSDFGLSLNGPSEDVSHLSLHAAGTMGYMDPEYYRLQQLTSKSDVYSFGVVLLEMLSGQKAIHKNANGVPRNVVDFVVPYITQDELHRVLDRSVPPPTPYEIEAVCYVGYLAADCVTLPGVDRPSMTEVVNSLERALEACSAAPPFSRSSTESSA
uniref:non-specific serine/threonine protein kinase n=1 Tax=Kalanchoe fedtschenkoi TaxID=63787 RepID=A0A7N0ZS75_KALFE